MGEPGIVDEEIDLRERWRQGRDRRVHRGLVAYVEHRGMNHVRAKLGDQLFQPLCPATGRDAAPAGRDKRAHRRFADPCGGAGHESGLHARSSPPSFIALAMIRSEMVRICSSVKLFSPG